MEEKVSPQEPSADLPQPADRPGQGGAAVVAAAEASRTPIRILAAALFATWLGGIEVGFERVEEDLQSLAIQRHIISRVGRMENLNERAAEARLRLRDLETQIEWSRREAAQVRALPQKEQQGRRGQAEALDGRAEALAAAMVDVRATLAEAADRQREWRERIAARTEELKGLQRSLRERQSFDVFGFRVAVPLRFAAVLWLSLAALLAWMVLRARRRIHAGLAQLAEGGGEIGRAEAGKLPFWVAPLPPRVDEVGRPRLRKALGWTQDYPWHALAAAMAAAAAAALILRLAHIGLAVAWAENDAAYSSAAVLTTLVAGLALGLILVPLASTLHAAREASPGPDRAVRTRRAVLAGAAAGGLLICSWAGLASARYGRALDAWRLDVARARAARRRRRRRAALALGSPPLPAGLYRHRRSGVLFGVNHAGEALGMAGAMPFGAAPSDPSGRMRYAQEARVLRTRLAAVAQEAGKPGPRSVPAIEDVARQLARAGQRAAAVDFLLRVADAALVRRAVPAERVERLQRRGARGRQAALAQLPPDAEALRRCIRLLDYAARLAGANDQQALIAIAGRADLFERAFRERAARMAALAPPQVADAPAHPRRNGRGYKPPGWHDRFLANKMRDRARVWRGRAGRIRTAGLPAPGSSNSSA